MNAQIAFIEGHFRLVHIPLSLCANFLPPILRVLFPQQAAGGRSEELDGRLEELAVHDGYGFLNISVTPLECSVVCHASLAQSLFAPVMSQLPKSEASQCSISDDTYIVFSVSSAGMEAGQRVIDLTAPLAMAGIPIFFITTYYTDFILVPTKDRHAVGQTLLARGFVFSETDSAYVASPTIGRARGRSVSEPPSTPPPSSVAELQTRTFTHLKKRSVVPFVEPNLRLVQCSGREVAFAADEDAYSSVTTPGMGPSSPSWLSSIDPKLYLGIVAALVQQPRFLSVTLTHDDAPSLLLDKDLLPLFEGAVVGDTDANLVPIFLDLATLSEGSTGIVCGVAGRLVQEMGGPWVGSNVGDGGGGGGGAGGGIMAELSYLSTARAGAVILGAEGSKIALEALLPLLASEDLNGGKAVDHGLGIR